MKPRLTKIWVDDRRNVTPDIAKDVLAIRADFDNDRHYEARIAYPYDREAVASALHSMAMMIGRDPLLAPPVLTDAPLDF